ncbi:hypothetical protein BGX21_005105 [Mortierella sp. AD011]|nr:hypothetical protein BGX20_003740 [Mortierella sp. AD010]KAF9403348.1 hypothetical protein BGX21_005105 [Mortierella sp. AD011]
MSEDCGCMSAAWIRGVNNLKNLNLKRRLKADWQATAKERKAFWDKLDEQERDQAYRRDLEKIVVGDKLYVAGQHSSRIQKDPVHSPTSTFSSSSAHISSSTSSSSAGPSLAQTAPTSSSSSPLPQTVSSPARSISSIKTVSSTARATTVTKQKTPSLEEPWQTLQDCAQKVSRKRPIPFLEFDISSMSETRAGLFRHAYDSLLLYQENGEDLVMLKDAFVALSCTLNLSGPNVKAYFPNEILELAMQQAVLPKKQSDILNVLDPFRQNLVDSDMEISKLLPLVVKCKADLMEKDKSNELEGKIIDIVEYLGETVVVASKDVQEILNKEFGDHSTYGRKADMLFKSKTELCNFEFKAEGTSQSEMKIQNRKNIRLNRCILEHLRQLGVTQPRILFADFQVI